MSIFITCFLYSSRLSRVWILLKDKYLFRNVWPAHLIFHTSPRQRIKISVMFTLQKKCLNSDFGVKLYDNTHKYVAERLMKNLRTVWWILFVVFVIDRTKFVKINWEIYLWGIVYYKNTGIWTKIYDIVKHTYNLKFIGIHLFPLNDSVQSNLANDLAKPLHFTRK